VLWLFFLWAYISKKQTLLTSSTPEGDEGVPRFQRRWRRRFLIGIFAVPALTGFWLGISEYIERSASNDIAILIANFDGDDRKPKITETVINRLRRAANEFPELRINALGKSISEQEGSEVARKEGRKSNMVIWGFYDEALTGTVHIELLHAPGVVSLRKKEIDFSVALVEKQSITIKAGLSGDMGLLTLLIVGLARYVAQDYDGAILRFSKALEQPATSQSTDYVSDVLAFRSNAFLIKNHISQAIVGYTHALALKPNSAEFYVNRGTAYAKEGDHDRALADYDRGVALKPDNANAYLNRGAAYVEIGDYRRGKADLDRAIILKPTSSGAYANRGSAHMLKGNYVQALTDYNHAITLQPKFALAYFLRGTLYGLTGRDDLALVEFDCAIAIRPDFAEAYVHRGLVYNNKRDYDRAIAEYNRAIALKPDLSEAYYNRASTHSAKGDDKQAIADLNRALFVKPDYGSAYAKRGALYFSIGDQRWAEADFDRAILLKIKDPVPYLIRAYLYEQKGDIPNAIATYQAAYKVADSPDKRAAAFRALQRLGVKPN
jgi:tetratricopeptide (TPR) repeat protein